MSRREAILNATLAAAEELEGLHFRQAVEAGKRGNVDVFGAILKNEVPLVFRPLDGLLGACLAGPGVMISTNRPLPIQRFTGAHELGHVIMRHSPSVDGEEILEAVDPGSTEAEIEANAFAVEFLLPKWLFSYHAKRQGWRKESMRNPDLVYQMALRAGASYSATVQSLERHGIIDGSERQRLLSVTPKQIKQRLLPGYSPDNWHLDIWLITEKDEGAFIEGQPQDLFRFQLNEKSGAGYLWDFDTLKSKGFVVMSDERAKQSDESAIGSDALRLVTAHSPMKQQGDLRFALKRPWQPTSCAAQLEFRYDLHGKEKGLPRAQRLAFVNR